MMRPAVGGEAGAKAGPKRRFLFSRNENGFAFKGVDEFVLTAVAVLERRYCARLEYGQVHSEIVQAEHIAKLAFDTPLHSRREFGGIIRRLASWRHICGDDCDRVCHHALRDRSIIMTLLG